MLSGELGFILDGPDTRSNYCHGYTGPIGSLTPPSCHLSLLELNVSAFVFIDRT